MSASAISGNLQKYVYKFKKANATRLNNAKRLEDLDISDSITLKRMISKGMVVKCQGNKYYLNLKSANLIQTKKSRASLIVFMIILIILLIIILALA